MNIKELCRNFNIEAETVHEHDQGLINGSYIITDTSGKKYLLQEINSHVFNDIHAVMHNINLTTSHIRNNAEKNGECVERSTLKVIPTKVYKNYEMIWGNDNRYHYYRMFDFIENASTYDQANEAIIHECGVGFGKFQKDLADFPAVELYETIPNFHNTHVRYVNFMNMLFKLRKEHQNHKIMEVYPEIQIASQYGLKYADIIVSALESGEIPLRVVHNDTKLNNIMIDDTTHKAVCAIDLDTVMPGSMLYDYGDAIRYCANSGAEDDTNLDNVKLDYDKFEAFTSGYLSQIADCVTQKELELMPQAPAIIAYELGLRFLTDYLDGNKYFKCNPSRPYHNLERARAQFKLMKEFEKNENLMRNTINRIYVNTVENELEQ